MGTGSVENRVLKWLGRLPTVPVPFFGRAKTVDSDRREYTNRPGDADRCLAQQNGRIGPMRVMPLSVAAAVFVCGVAASVALAQKDAGDPPGGAGNPRGAARQPNKPKLVALSGEVVKVVKVKTEPRKMTTGRSPLVTYFVMKTPDGKTVNIHLGPAKIVESVAKKLPRGEKVKVEAYRTKNTAKRHYIARSLTIGDRTIELRDKTLRPTWAAPGVLKERPGKIAVTAVKASLDAAVDPRFGRCAYFLIVDAQQGTFEALENTNADAGRRAGVQSAQMIASKGATLLLTGNCGQSASGALSAAGIQVVPGCSGIVRDVIKQYKEGKLIPTGDPGTAPHSGAGPRSTAPKRPSESSLP